MNAVIESESGRRSQPAARRGCSKIRSTKLEIRNKSQRRKFERSKQIKNGLRQRINTNNKRRVTLPSHQHRAESMEPRVTSKKLYLLVLTLKTEQPNQCCWLSLLAMETGDEDRFERDERFRVRNPAGSMVVSSGVASAPGRGTSSSAKMLLYIHTRPHDHVGAGSQILEALWAQRIRVSSENFLFSIKFSNTYM